MFQIVSVKITTGVIIILNGSNIQLPSTQIHSDHKIQKLQVFYKSTNGELVARYAQFCPYFD